MQVGGQHADHELRVFTLDLGSNPGHHIFFITRHKGMKKTRTIKGIKQTYLVVFDD